MITHNPSPPLKTAQILSAEVGAVLYIKLRPDTNVNTSEVSAVNSVLISFDWQIFCEHNQPTNHVQLRLLGRTNLHKYFFSDGADFLSQRWRSGAWGVDQLFTERPVSYLPEHHAQRNIKSIHIDMVLGISI